MLLANSSPRRLIQISSTHYVRMATVTDSRLSLDPGITDEEENWAQKWGFRLLPVQRNLLSFASKTENCLGKYRPFSNFFFVSTSAFSCCTVWNAFLVICKLFFLRVACCVLSPAGSRRSAITSRQMSRETFTSATTTTMADSEDIDGAAVLEGVLRDITTTSGEEVDGPDDEEGDDGEEEMSPVAADNDEPVREKVKTYHGPVRVKLTARREMKPKPQATSRDVDLRWNPMCTTRMNQDNQRYAEEKLMRDMIAHLALPRLRQQGHYPGGVFRKLVLDLQDKANREARNLKLNTRSAVAAAMAAAKFKAKLVDKKVPG